MDIQKFTIKSQEALSQAQSIASSNGNQSIETGHLLKVLFMNDSEVVPYLLGKLNVNQKNLEQALDRILLTYSKVEGGEIYLSKGLNRILQNAENELKIFGDDYI